MVPPSSGLSRLPFVTDPSWLSQGRAWKSLGQLLDGGFMSRY